MAYGAPRSCSFLPRHNLAVNHPSRPLLLDQLDQPGENVELLAFQPAFVHPRLDVEDRLRGEHLDLGELLVPDVDGRVEHLVHAEDGKLGEPL